MALHTAAGSRRLMDEGLEPRVVLRVYAAVTLVAGCSMTATGIRGIDGLPLSHESILWMAGMAVAGAGCAAVGLAVNGDPAARRQGLRWFAAGHLPLGLMVWMQWAVYWRTQGLPLGVALTPLAAGLGLMGIALRPPRAHGPGRGQPARIGSSYDEHIRQMARREERARLARDLHDAVKQQLFVIQTAAATAQATFDEDAAGARAALAHVREAARDATAEMAALLDELQAAPLEHTGLVEAIRKQCEALALRTGAEVVFEPGPPPPARALPPGAHEAIYRVAQEALANVARHARASRVTVSLQARPTVVELRIADNGAGFDAGRTTRGMGIANMGARAAETGGRVTIAGASPGTEVVLSVPVRHPAVRALRLTSAAFALYALSQMVMYVMFGSWSAPPSWWILAMLLAAALQVVAAARAVRRTRPR